MYVRNYSFRLVQIWTVFLSCLLLHTNGDCFTSPISVSSVNNCINGICSTNQVATFSVPTVTGSSACVSFKDISTGLVVKTFNFTVTDSAFNANVDNCYYTDDVVIQSVGFCGCTGGTTATCSSCPVSLSGSGTYDCTGSVHNNAYCLFNSGTYCVKHKVTGVPRFKICQLKSTLVQNLHLKMSTDNSTTSLDFQGLTVSSSDVNGLFNATVVSTTSLPPDRPQFVVYDKYDNSDFYILDGTQVNGINDYDMNKIGWAKIKDRVVTLPPNFASSVGVSIRDCQTNVFSVTYPVKQTSVILNTLKDHLSQRLPYNSAFLDDEKIFETGANIGEPNHSVTPFVPLGEGIVYSTTVGGPSIYYGFSTTGQYTGTNGVIANLNYLIWNGTGLAYTNISISQSSTEFCDANVTPCTDSSTYKFIVHCPITGCVWCLRRKSDTQCIYDTNVGVYVFPHDRITLVKIGLDAQMKLSDTDSLTNSPSTLSMSTTVGSALLTVVFKNFTIAFQTSVADPSITNVNQVGDFVVVTALSKTSPGDCIIASAPAGVISAQKISITTSANDYKLPITSIINGTIDIEIRCAEKVTKRAVFLDEAQTESLLKSDPTITPGFNNVDDFTQIFTHGAVSSAFNPFDDFNWGTIITYVIAAIAIVITVFLMVYLGRKLIRRKIITQMEFIDKRRKIF